MFRELLCEDVLGIVDVQVGEIHEQLAHSHVQHNGIALLHEFTNDLPFFVFNNQNLQESHKGENEGRMKRSKWSYLFGFDHLFYDN